jgi:long-chain acyl-CoA synthetase
LASSRIDDYRQISRIARALRGLGLEKGDRLAIVARTRREWYLAEMAGLMAGAMIVGIDHQASAEQLCFVLSHAGVSGLVAEQPGPLAKIGAPELSRLKFAIAIDTPPGETLPSGIVSWDDLPPGLPEHNLPVPISPDDGAALVYTAGTTGMSKGIEYSHRKIMAGCKALVDAYSELHEGEASICWLPMAHLYQRMTNLLSIAHGMTIYFADRPDQVLAVAALANPSIFFAVPRFYEKLAETIRHAPNSRSALRDLIGENVRYAITGAAPMPLWAMECLWNAGLPLIEAYGVSENPVPIATNLPHNRRAGSVGKPFPGNQLKLADDGEILVKGPALFSGYFREEQPPHYFTEEGYYKTGDLGHFDEDGFLFLEGRKADIIKTSTGRRISPVQVEAVYGESPYLDRVVVCGNGRKHLVALLSLNTDAITQALGGDAVDRPGNDPKVSELLWQDLGTRGEKLTPYERIKAFAILPAPLSVTGGELTPTLKLRRKQIETRHAALIDGLYEQEAGQEGGKKP